MPRQHYKNALQREKKAKHKAGKLQEVVDDVYIQLKDAYKARTITEGSLAQLCVGAADSVQTVCQLQQHVSTLSQHVQHNTEELMSRSTQIKEQQELVSTLWECHALIHCQKDTLCKRLAHQNKKMINSKQDLLHAETSIHHYNLKEGASVRQEKPRI
ncbi:hypothetical protein RSAG8_12200, partial [Rhizoctonia solani AG-8 WAC10335]